MTIRKQPHIVSTIDITNEKGETLLFRHTFQPYLHLVGLPQGRLHFEERVAQAAERELFEKTGLKDIPLTHRGIVYIYATKQGEDISRIVANVFTGTVKDRPEVNSDERKGNAYWGKHSELTPQECMPGFLEVKALLEGKPFFFAEIDCEMATN
ncbi:MAG TPA: NUDIX hydrolase [Candidatus Saccharimonadales bacterium]